MSYSNLANMTNLVSRLHYDLIRVTDIPVGSYVSGTTLQICKKLDDDYNGDALCRFIR